MNFCTFSRNCQISNWAFSSLILTFAIVITFFPHNATFPALKFHFDHCLTIGHFLLAHTKNRLLTVKRFPSLLKDFLFKIDIRGNFLTVKGLSFQMLSFYWQSISFGLEMKFFVVQRKCNFENKRKQIVWYNTWINKSRD